MSRKPRITIPDVPHHICHRGNNQQPVFIEHYDRQDYFANLRARCLTWGLKIVGYCLMTNHIHLVAIPSDLNSISKAIQIAHSRYSLNFNLRHSRSGHLWESRFFSCPLDDTHLISTLLYVDRNPVRAGLVSDPRKYQWSSAQAHLGKNDPADLIDQDAWQRLSSLSDYPDLLQQDDDLFFLNEIRLSTRLGTPVFGVCHRD
jgi:putative transposase